jgi:integrase
LRVSKEGHRSWGFRFRINGRERTAGLGSAHRVELKQARELAAAMGRLLAAGLDPLDERAKQRAAARAQAARLLTFSEAARRYIADREGSWGNEQYRKDVRNSLATHVLPVLGSLSVADIDTPLVLRVLERDNFWRGKPVLADRCRNRIEAILDWAAARGYRDAVNPARWRGHLDKILASPKSLSPTRHHPALPWREVPTFMAELRSRDGNLPRTLEFTILTGGRIGEVVGATWSEIDLAARTWTIPAARMKSAREHVVPLSPRALEILRALDVEGANGPLQRIFPAHRTTVGLFLRQWRPDITVHGFRSTFSTWCAEATRFEAAVREAALAHVIKDATERSYQRGTMLQKRRQLMDAWSGYCTAPPAISATTVIALSRT